jgi:hypothetical protein
MVVELLGFSTVLVEEPTFCPDLHPSFHELRAIVSGWISASAFEAALFLNPPRYKEELHR